ncbi:DMT family transporter [Desulfonatronovibrio hydrogenovorans]|uniref:DMT family transporter n=1 Tax=Desulfonatronovibrio hydrogenovorans TaxID=53245 RepID=UPI00048F791E|nr:DMT family transporter [Desulfonatronovibrio hydrogenovorans]
MLVYIKLLLATLFWGGTFTAGRIVARDIPPFSASFLRFFIATICLVYLVRRLEGGLPKINSSQLIQVLLLGMTGVFAYNVFFFTGLQTVEAGRAAVIVATNPIFIALLAALLFREALGPVKAFGILLSVGGAILAITRGHPFHLLNQVVSMGDLAIAGCVASWAIYSILGKYSMSRLSPHSAVTYSCLAGTLALLGPALSEGLLDIMPSLSLIVWLCLAYLGFFGTVLGFTWYYQAVKIIGPSRAAVFINFVPLFAIIIGYVFLGESVDPSLIIGAVMVSSGVYLANRVRMKTRPSTLPTHET